MRYRKLGNTGLSVSEIGFGTIPILRGNVPVLPEHLDPDTETAVDIMMYAFGMGCNFYDTAIPEEYGDAEYKLGIFAQRVGREKIIISDKARMTFQKRSNLHNAKDIIILKPEQFLKEKIPLRVLYIYFKS